MDQGSNRGGSQRQCLFFESLIADLEEFAEHEFKLNIPGKDGLSQREHLEQVERQTGKRPKELDGPEFPELLSHIWSAFTILNSTRSVGFSGPNPISFGDIKAWMELTETPLTALEVEAIIKLDKVYMRAVND